MEIYLCMHYVKKSDMTKQELLRILSNPDLGINLNPIHIDGLDDDYFEVFGDYCKQ